jgi:sulfite exporter TauE/SafE
VIFAAAAALGVMSSAHCVAMCGPLVLLVSGPGEGTGARQLARAALYHSGRTTSYAILGAAAGGAGHLATSMGLGQTLAVTFGVVLIVAALARTARVGRHALRAPLMPVVAAASRGARRLRTRFPRLGLYALGLANGLLPCGMVYAALALALTAESPGQAAAVMAAFGAATTPALIATVLAAGLVSGRWRQRLTTALPLAIAATGVLLIVRGLTAQCH